MRDISRKKLGQTDTHRDKVCRSLQSTDNDDKIMSIKHLRKLYYQKQNILGRLGGKHKRHKKMLPTVLFSHI